MESHFCTVSQIFLAIPIMNPLARVHDNRILEKLSRIAYFKVISLP